MRGNKLHIDVLGVDGCLWQTDVHAIQGSAKCAAGIKKLADFGLSERNGTCRPRTRPIRPASIGIQTGGDVYGQDGTGNIPKRFDCTCYKPAGAATHSGSEEGIYRRGCTGKCAADASQIIEIPNFRDLEAVFPGAVQVVACIAPYLVFRCQQKSRDGSARGRGEICNNESVAAVVALAAENDDAFSREFINKIAKHPGTATPRTFH